jgi:hypothetical protein
MEITSECAEQIPWIETFEWESEQSFSLIDPFAAPGRQAQALLARLPTLAFVRVP